MFPLTRVPLWYPFFEPQPTGLFLKRSGPHGESTRTPHSLIRGRQQHILRLHVSVDDAQRLPTRVPGGPVRSRTASCGKFICWLVTHRSRERKREKEKEKERERKSKKP